MKLYLVQHGNQNPEEIDPDEGLSEKGLTDCEKVAAFIEKTGVKVEIMYHSVKVRAKQTAEIFAKHVMSGAPEEMEGLKPMDEVNVWPDNINKLNMDLMIVGHMPFMQKLSSLLLTGNEGKKVINFQQGGIVCLEMEEGGWGINFMIIPDLI